LNVILLGATSFIGINLAIKLSERKDVHLTLVDAKDEYFETIRKLNLPNTIFKVCTFSDETDFNSLLEKQDIVYHLVSTTIPSTSNQHIYIEIKANIDVTALLLDACVQNNIKQLIFFSSGGAVYGKENKCPLKEETPTYPITSYGIQKITIEKLIYLYNYMYGLDYRVVRLSNPYGPYQRPNGILGAVNTFIYRALKKEEIVVYGDGSVIRDFIYIDDAIAAVIRLSDSTTKQKTFNIGSGKGTSINELLGEIKKTLNLDLNIKYTEGRKIDVPVNYLDVSKYEKYYGKISTNTLSDGVVKTANFIKQFYGL